MCHQYNLVLVMITFWNIIALFFKNFFKLSGTCLETFNGNVNGNNNTNLQTILSRIGKNGNNDGNCKGNCLRTVLGNSNGNSNINGINGLYNKYRNRNSEKRLSIFWIQWQLKNSVTLVRGAISIWISSTTNWYSENSHSLFDDALNIQKK